MTTFYVDANRNICAVVNGHAQLTGWVAVVQRSPLGWAVAPGKGYWQKGQHVTQTHGVAQQIAPPLIDPAQFMAITGWQLPPQNFPGL